MQPEWLTYVPQIGKEKVKDELFFFFKQFVRDLWKFPTLELGEEARAKKKKKKVLL